MPTDADIAQDPAVLSAEQAAQTAADTTTLPPAGDARRDELKRRADALDAAADQLREAAGIAAADASAFDVDNEIGRFAGNGLDGSQVSGALADYVYVWEQADIHNRFGGLWVTQAKSKGWEVVSGSMPEASERRFVDGTRRWGDTILLRMPRERYEALEAADRRRRLARTEGVSIALLEEAERKGLAVYDLDNPQTPRAREIAQAQRAAAEAARSTMVSTMRQAGRSGAQRVLASELATKRLDRAIRTGTVPGLTPGA